MKLKYIHKKKLITSNEQLYKEAFNEACAIIMMETDLYKTMASARNSILIRIKKMYDVKIVNTNNYELVRRKNRRTNKGIGKKS